MLVTMVADKAPTRWDDDVIFEFEKLLQNMVNKIENQALELSGELADPSVGLKLGNLVERRIVSLIDRLEEISGKEAVQQALERYLVDLNQNKDQKRGHPKRSA
jgi:hypothetical protein